MSKRKIDNTELLRRILRFDDDLLRDDYPQALVDEELREAGGDPEQVGAETEAFVKKLMADRADAASRKESRTRLRSTTKTTSEAQPAKARLTDPVEQWKALQSIGANDMLEPDYPKALVDQDLREAGLDPEQVGAEEGEAFVKKLRAEKAEVASRKTSRTQLRSAAKAMSSSPPAKTFSTLPPMRAKQPSDTGPLDDGE